MGLFDSFANAGRHDVADRASAATRTEQAATRMLEEGMALEQRGETDAALRCYESAIRLRPELARAHFNRGNILLDRGDAASALEAYAKAVAFKPDSAASHYNRGIAHISLGDAEAGVTAYRQAIALKPDFLDAHYQLGIAYYDLGRFLEASQCFSQAIAIDSSLAAIHNNLGNALKELERFDDAVASYVCALTIDPQLSAAHNNLGLAYRELMRLSDAVASFNRAIGLAPNFADAYANLGNVLKDLGRLGESLTILERAIQIDPDCSTAHNILLFVQNYAVDTPADRLLADARRFGAFAARSASPYTVWPNPPDPHRFLRIGVVSGDLCGHSVGYFLEAVLSSLTAPVNPNLALFAYSTRIREDETFTRLRACFQSFQSAIGLSDEALARRIRDDKIDILIDLSGHTAHNRLPVFAWKPAPVQVSWLGYCATTGVSEIDYYIADPISLPPALESQFIETIWRLPESYLCLSQPSSDIAVSPPPSLSTGKITFGSFNNLSKMSDATVHLWARLLQALPTSMLFLKSKQLDNKDVLDSTIARYAAHGVDGHRLILEGHTRERNSHLSAYRRVDIALDPFPYNGVTTTAEALWMGVPVLALAGDRFLSRQGMSLLMNAGLPDWIADTPDDYVARAVLHASDPQRLAALRAGLRQQVLASPIFDAPRFARHFEAALRGMWTRWCEAQRSR